MTRHALSEVPNVPASSAPGDYHFPSAFVEEFATSYGEYAAAEGRMDHQEAQGTTYQALRVRFLTDFIRSRHLAAHGTPEQLFQDYALWVARDIGARVPKAVVEILARPPELLAKKKRAPRRKGRLQSSDDSPVDLWLSSISDLVGDLEAEHGELHELDGEFVADPADESLSGNAIQTYAIKLYHTLSADGVKDENLRALGELLFHESK